MSNDHLDSELFKQMVGGIIKKIGSPYTRINNIFASLLMCSLEQLELMTHWLKEATWI
jgi:hypothetical protein